MDKMIFLPCKQSPHKLTKKNAPDQHRLAMCQLAVSALPWAVVDDYELNAPPPSYSWRTAEFMQEKYPEAELYWLMGTDQWEAILRWDRPQYLATLVNFIVISRGDEPKKIDGLTFIKLAGSHSASSTCARKKINSHQASAWLKPSVLAYINEHHIY
jgi:nicotinate-nucleotide adenylyltransferase